MANRDSCVSRRNVGRTKSRTECARGDAISQTGALRGGLWSQGCEIFMKRCDTWNKPREWISVGVRGRSFPQRDLQGGGRPLGHTVGYPEDRCPPFKMKGRGLKWRPVVSLIHTFFGGGARATAAWCTAFRGRRAASLWRVWHAQFHLVPLKRGPGVFYFSFLLFFF